MRRADRLFQIVQHLRARRLTTAKQLAGWLRVSERTVYRDVRDLSLSGIPVMGEAGVGYRLDRGFDLRPIMFTQIEIEAAVLGLRMVEAFAGPDFTPHVQSALAKIALALPAERREEVESPRLFAPMMAGDAAAWDRIGCLREALAGRVKVRCVYRDDEGRESQRTLRPLALFFWGKVWTLAAWCELRDDFRNFRLDRMDTLELLSETFIEEPGKSLERFRELIAKRVFRKT